MTKKFFTLIGLVVAAFSGFAGEVDPTVAANTGLNFWASKANGLKSVPAVVKTYTVAEEGRNLYYVFDIAPEGFVIVSAEDAIRPILGYSFEDSYKAEDQAPAFQYWMGQYKNVIKTVRAQRKVANEGIAAEWELYASPLTQKSSEKSVAALVLTKWNQGMYYNYYCPQHPTGPDGRCYTGCVATAMAQIMKFWEYPASGFGSHSYEHAYFGTIAADFSAANTNGVDGYDWAGMTVYGTNTSKEAIGELMFHCGVSVDMNYTPLSSGSFTELCVDALKNYFHYRSTITILDQADYTWFDWKYILVDNLDEGKPVLYSGSGGTGGHAWVCDGYQDTSAFHMNWGWGGSNNGFFDVTNLTDFPDGHQIVVNIIPNDEYYCVAKKTLTLPSATFGDGSGYSFYWNNTDCDWLIQPPTATSITLNFTNMNTESGADVVSVYNGATTAAPLLGTWSGFEMPSTLTSTGGSMLVTFTSDGANQGQGFEAYYTATFPAGTEEASIENNTAIYPNPAHGTFNVRFGNPLTEEVSVNVFNVTGQLMNSQIISANTSNAVINISNLPQGVYMVNIKGQQGNFSSKIVVK